MGLNRLCLAAFLTSLIAGLDDGLSCNPFGSNSIRLGIGQGWLNARMGNFQSLRVGECLMRTSED